MPYVTVNDMRIYYEFTGPEDGPLILQFGGSLFGRQNFGSVNDGHPERTIAACADCAFARCDVYRRTMFRSWRKMAEAMPLDDFCDLLTIQAVSADFIEANPDIFDTVRRVVAKNSPYTVRQACLAMETMDLESLARSLRRPILFTNGTRDIMTPPDLAPSGFSARQIVAAVPEFAGLHEFPAIGHADLLEVPTEAVEVVGAFFQEVLAREDAAVTA